MSTHSFRSPSGPLRIAINSAVMKLFELHQQRRFWQPERGGLLFTEDVVADDESRVTVSDASPPHKRDRAGRAWLELDHQRCLKEIRDRFESGLHFIGYWHSHPEANPRFSGTDVAAFRGLIGGRGFDLDRLVVIVVGNRPDSLSLDLALFDLKTSDLERFELEVR